MDRFVYRKQAGITALSASFTDFKYKNHAHKEYALGVTLRGIQEYNLEGSHQLSHQNGIMLFSPDQPHDGMAHDRTGLDYIMVYIETEQFLEILGRKEMFRFSSPIIYNQELKQKIINLHSAILNKMDEAFCSELLLSLGDSFTRPGLIKAYRNENSLIKKAKNMIHGNLENVIKLDDICNELEMSKFQLIRMFKSNTGISPYQYFLTCKIEFAKEIIEKTHDIYSAVAECDFVDLTHLNKHFKRIYGITAFQYLSDLTAR